MIHELNVKEMANNDLKECAKKVEALPYKLNLNTIMVSPSPQSKLFVGNKTKRLNKIGANNIIKTFEGNSITTGLLVDYIECLQAKFDKSEDFNGVMVQLPLPEHIDEQSVLDAIKPKYDVDALSTASMDMLYNNTHAILPATVQGIMNLIYDKCNKDKLSIRDLRIAVVGRGKTVGKPLITHLNNLGTTLLTCNSRTDNVSLAVAGCDVIISAVGKHDIFEGNRYIVDEQSRLEWAWHKKIQPLLIDVGINFVNGKLCGDISHEQYKENGIVDTGANYTYTPVPNGVGQLTTANVAINLFKLAKIRGEWNEC